ncbi:uncharacterized protein DFL_004527 [Arthrobotrys flagrans]|uniref:Uncharacterized protein n=1 Tax=Arthrobotrys flagrans TaxID=97331 RepID=A0A437A5G5_ARTFL|nr:hypothetical protein DFL_004527 [Arthrobotrys flagrans]
MQLIHLLSIITVLGGALAVPAPSLDDYKPTPAKRDPKSPSLNIVYETTAPIAKPKPDPRPIYVRPKPNLRPIYGNPMPKPHSIHVKPIHVKPIHVKPIHVKPIVNPATIVRMAIVKPGPTPNTKPYKWREISEKIGGRSAAAVDPDKPIHILPFPQYTGPPIIENPEDPEEQPEPVRKLKPTTTTTTTTTTTIKTTTTTSKPTATPTKKSESWKLPAKVRPPYYQPWYGVDGDYKGPKA